MYYKYIWCADSDEAYDFPFVIVNDIFNFGSE